LKNGDVRSWTFDPQDLGLPYARLSDLRVGSVDESADVVSRILIGQLGPPRDIAALNAAAALVVAEKAMDLQDGLARVDEAIETGRARETLEKLVRLSHAG
jgi:anthranilate phosphoribosyltransferase